MNRRLFLRRSLLASAGALVTGDAALALLEQLTHRKVWALGAVPDMNALWARTPWGAFDPFHATISHIALYDERTQRVLALGALDRPQSVREPLRHTFAAVAPGGQAGAIAMLDRNRHPIYTVQFNSPAILPNGGDISVQAPGLRLVF